ncbi:unnamed protein product [Darwinula stevensoni]|uniref:Uncharacterized protein n=1 Tax=Darwinula stevensoni TaxID=69355 RepID=A0A7R8XBG2_9CRUS|nr:unnamed protein product [Darwinula stevensoni]CAG0886449.1 unnamed protein product [Darwinula stevensoni]
MLLIEEYLSFPTNTLYVIEDVEKIPTPAFTFCPKPSVKSRFPPNLNSSYKVDAFLGGTTFAEKFKQLAITLHQLIRAPHNSDWLDDFESSTVNGETIRSLSSGYWSERIFLGENSTNNDMGGYHYFMCFTFHWKKKLSTGSRSCKENFFKLNFEMITDSVEQTIEVYVHDAREEFTNFHFFDSEQVILFNDSVTRLFIRPEGIQKRSKRTDPCIDDEAYSYTRCKENCIWEKMLARHNLKGLSCFMPALLTKEVNLTILECNNWKDETSSFSQIPHFLEKEKVTLLDLLSSIGGIVGICLGASLVTLFDIAEMVCSRIPCRFFPRRNEVVATGNH